MISAVLKLNELKGPNNPQDIGLFFSQVFGVLRSLRGLLGIIYMVPEVFGRYTWRVNAFDLCSNKLPV